MRNKVMNTLGNSRHSIRGRHLENLLRRSLLLYKTISQALAFFSGFTYDLEKMSNVS